jgi:hypothetical protein
MQEFIECWHELLKWTQQSQNLSSYHQLSLHSSYDAFGQDGSSFDFIGPATDLPCDAQPDNQLKWHLNPGQLISIIEALPTVKNREWLDVACINLPLCLLALQEESHVQYVPLEFHHPSHLLEKVEMDRYRSVFLGHQAVHRHNWICTLVHKEGGHWFGLLGHPVRQQVFVLGREMVKSTANVLHSWQEWGGPQIWKTMCTLNRCNSIVESVQSISWTQNGYDCGPDIAHVLMTFMRCGVTPTSTGTILIPTIPCGHSFRIKVGRQLLDYTRIHIKEFLDVCDQNPLQAASVDPEWQHTQAQYREYLTHWAVDSQWPVKRVLKRLKKATEVCPGCLQTSHTVYSDMPPAAMFTEMKGAKLHPGIIADMVSPATPEDHTGGTSEVAEAVGVAEGYSAESDGGEEDAEEDEDSEKEDGEEGEDSEDSDLGSNDDTAQEVKVETLKDILERDTSPASAPRFGRPHKAPRVPTFRWSPGEWNNRHAHFDKYGDGPVLATPASEQEDNSSGPQTIYNMADNAGKISLEWSIDRAWRLLPDYANMFPQRRPCDVSAHLMPVMPIAPSIWEPIQGLAHGRSGKTIFTMDAVDMSLLEMIQHADSVGSKEIFVTGRKGLQPTQQEATPPPLVRIAMHKDECQLESGVQMTTDVDSGIWITRHPKFKHKFSVFLGPLYSSMRKPPIWKHNHLYINLLVPQLAEDRQKCLEDPEQPDRKEYWVKEFKLSQIPHISLGQEGSVFLHIFFPRLTHKRPGSRFYASMVPYHVQLLFFKELLLPALLDEVLDDPEKVYTSLSQEQLQFQNATSPKLCPLHPDQWEKLVDIIHRKVHNQTLQETTINLFRKDTRCQYSTFYLWLLLLCS